MSVLVSSASFQSLCNEIRENYSIDPKLSERYNVKRGLRNSDNTGVLAGLTNICNVHGYIINEGEKTPDDGRLTYRGVDVHTIVESCEQENRFGYEEAVYLLLFGKLPTANKLEQFRAMIADCRELPMNFAEDMIIKAPSPNIMNKLERNVLSMYSYDDNPDDLSVENLLRQSIELIAQVPTAMIYAYQVKRRQYDHKSMYFHPIDPAHWTAEYILSSLRLDRQFTDAEAKLLDVCMILPLPRACCPRRAPILIRPSPLPSARSRARATAVPTSRSARCWKPSRKTSATCTTMKRLPHFLKRSPAARQATAAD